MDDMTFGVEIVQSVKYHLNHDFQKLRGYHTAEEPISVEPEGLSQGLKDGTEMWSWFILQSK